MSSIRPPAEWSGKQVSTLDVVLFIREQVMRGVGPEMFIGKPDAYLFAAFVTGVHFHLYCCGGQDPQYTEFLRWMREEKKELLPVGGWPPKLLEDAGGDHRKAIQVFLDRCAEFVAAAAS
jgi:hypothetical protein